MKKPIKIGERVVADFCRQGGFYRTVRGTLEKILPDRVVIKEKSGICYDCSPCSMRRLANKKRLRIWVTVCRIDNAFGAIFTKEPPSKDCGFGWQMKEFIEVRKKAEK
jgi:hypothetical protein